MKALLWKDIWTNMFITVLFVVATIRSIEVWLNKPWFVHTLEYYAIIKRNEVDPVSIHVPMILQVIKNKYRKLI